MKGEMLVYITLQESVLPSGDVARDLVFLYSITMADTVSNTGCPRKLVTLLTCYYAIFYIITVTFYMNGDY